MRQLIKSIAPYVYSAFLITVAVGMSSLAYSVNELKKEIREIYNLHVVQAKQIDTLLNLRIRESREEEQAWIKKTKEKYHLSTEPKGEEK
jgi:hypothetical protein|tara:strand:- start:481 stop:750 length:270 start_codon:yes stop_codon:yes gene_type:complete